MGGLGSGGPGGFALPPRQGWEGESTPVWAGCALLRRLVPPGELVAALHSPSSAPCPWASFSGRCRAGSWRSPALPLRAGAELRGWAKPWQKRGCAPGAPTSPAAPVAPSSRRRSCFLSCLGSAGSPAEHDDGFLGQGSGQEAVVRGVRQLGPLHALAGKPSAHVAVEEQLCKGHGAPWAVLPSHTRSF